MNLPSVKGLRQFLDSSSSARGWRRGAPCADAETARIPRTALQIRRPLRETASAAAGAGRPRHPPPLRRNLHPHPAHDRALLLVRVLPALDLRQAARPRQCELDGAVHACCRTATTSAPGSSCICPISPPTDRPSPTISTTPSSNAASSGPKTSAIPSGRPDTFGVKVRGAASIRAFLATPAAPRHPPLQPHPHEPRPQRLSGEPLLQPGRCHARRLILFPTPRDLCSNKVRGSANILAIDSNVVVRPFTGPLGVRRQCEDR